MPTLRAAACTTVTAITRGNDVFGAAVNLAARVSAEAYARGSARNEAHRGCRALKRGLPRPSSARCRSRTSGISCCSTRWRFMLGDTDTPIDPVCRMPIDRRSAVGSFCVSEQRVPGFARSTARLPSRAAPRGTRARQNGGE